MGWATKSFQVGILPLKYFAIDVRQRAELQIPLEGVVAVELEVGVDLVRLHHGDVLEAVAEAKGAVVMEVVAEEHVGRRGLRRHRLEGRVRVEHRHHRQPAVVADAEHADPAVVVRHVLEEPVDGVVGVGAFVDGLGVVLGRAAGGT